MTVDEHEKQRRFVIGPEDAPTQKLPVIDPQLAPTKKLRDRPDHSQGSTQQLRAVMLAESQPFLAGVSGITPLPVETQIELMIDAEWYRRLYAWMDRVSNRNAAKIMQLLSFLIIGGSASFINLLIVFAFDIADHAHHNDLLRHAIYATIATEVSLIYNFMLNDRFTFHSMIDQRRSWLQRCIRFHAPASVGFVLTLVLSSVFFAMTSALPHHAVVSQAMAILIVTAVNFLMHRFWTYRPRAAVAT